MLWRKVMKGLSAGRVQSVATRLVVERERERMRFRAADYWDIVATLDRACRSAPRCRVDGKKVAQGRDFARNGELVADSRRAMPCSSTRPSAAGALAGRAARRRRSPSARSSASRTPAGRRAVHDLDAAAGGEPQAPLLGAAHDARRPAPLRERLHHLHAHRLDDPVGVRRSPPRATRPASSTAPSPSRRAAHTTTGRSRTRRRPTRRSGRPATASARPTS